MTQTDINFIQTGGQVGLVRRAPTFTLGLHSNGTYYACDDEQDGKWVAVGFKSLDALTAYLKPICDHRTLARV